MGIKLGDLISEMVKRKASDLHIKAGSPPGLRVNGNLVPMEGQPSLSAEMVRDLVSQLADPGRLADFDKRRDYDFSKHLEGVARFRINLFHQRGSCAAVLRQIPIEVPALESLGMPEVVKELCKLPRGLVLVTGPTGSGKSTTLAAMVDYINRHEEGHILTLEDPIEFIHKDKKCFVSQREISSDSLSFSNALRAAMREDPDYILVGEMRDLETIGMAVTAAETGHLVFGTLHTTSAVQTLDRVIDVFPHEGQAQIRSQLAMTIQGVLCQALAPKIGGGRACGQEIMIGTDAIRNCIREGKTHQLINMLQTGAQHGMQTLESSLERLVLEGKVRAEDAIAVANNPAWLTQALERAGVLPSKTEASDDSKGSGAGVRKPSTKDLAERFAQAAGVHRAAAAPPAALAAQGQPSAAGPGDDFEKFRAMRRSV